MALMKKKSKIAAAAFVQMQKHVSSRSCMTAGRQLQFGSNVRINRFKQDGEKFQKGAFLCNFLKDNRSQSSIISNSIDSPASPGGRIRVLSRYFVPYKRQHAELKMWTRLKEQFTQTNRSFTAKLSLETCFKT